MLDTETKRRIDTCRDILVGKVPDPKSQVEQITIALIYKFMDDMDAEAEELGGKRAFFAGDFAKYGWAKLMAPNLGGYDVLNLYSEAIGKMNENPGVPALFRDIFKNAYLPYRDPETLRSFLKEINSFTYDHSERLGDAFEYLLSVLGSQGDAGQFRTPRHIIDFMVALIDPQKDEKILDPACGTAGFLISAYKHILKQNTQERILRLTPEERTRLAANIHGYDISPDMVRLSLVNLYLHGFSNPRIEEYDTLTSEERWYEYADVILANPPFMSPKGGIKPHKRFSVQANRSEVLFVDYIAEHLTPTGRAAVVVPEGIIFQSGTAYKSLRKLLVEQYLVAVISLPAGVFNPYSGVKTSILLMDRKLAKKSDSILFAKIENDGFGLGAQRRAIDKNDLPVMVEQIKAWLATISSGYAFDITSSQNMHLVEKARIGETGEYNLSGERYIHATFSHSAFDVVPIAAVCKVNPPKAELNGLPEHTEVSFVPMQDVAENHIHFTPKEKRELGEVLKGAYTYFRNDDVLLAKVTPCFENGKAGVAKDLINGIGFGSSEFYVLRASERILPELVYYFVASERFKDQAIPKMTGTGGLQRVPKSVVSEFLIPLPPLAVQQEIVAEIEGYQRIIDGARQVVEHYRPRIVIDPAWPVVDLKSLANQITDGTHKTPVYTDSGVPFLRVTDITNSDGSKKFISREEHLELIKRCKPERGDILYSKNGTIGVAKMVDWDYEFSIFVSLAMIKPDKTKIDSAYLEILMNSPYIYQQAMAHSKSGTVTNLHLIEIKQFLIPLPDLATQRAIVTEIEAEQRLVAANRALIDRFTAKIARVINRVWEG